MDDPLLAGSLVRREVDLRLGTVVERHRHRQAARVVRERLVLARGQVAELERIVARDRQLGRARRPVGHVDEGLARRLAPPERRADPLGHGLGSGAQLEHLAAAEEEAVAQRPPGERARVVGLEQAGHIAVPRIDRPRRAVHHERDGLPAARPRRVACAERARVDEGPLRLGAGRGRGGRRRAGGRRGGLVVDPVQDAASSSTVATTPERPPARMARWYARAEPRVDPPRVPSTVVGDDAMLEAIRDAVIGDDVAVDGPFGVRRVTYADYTASGRSLSFVEDVIRDEVLPLYANTHSESSGTGRQTTRFREDARAIIREACGADDRYAVVFTGSGSDRRDRHVHRLPGAPAAGGARRPVPPARAHPARGSAGRVRGSLRAPLERAPLARVDRRRRDDPRGPRRADRPRGARARARASRGPAAQDRLVLGGVERDGDPVRHARRLGAAAPARGALLLGLRGGGARTSTSRWPRTGPVPTPSSTRWTRSSCRRTSSSADRAPRGCWSRGATCSRTGCPRSPAAGPSST